MGYRWLLWGTDGYYGVQKVVMGKEVCNGVKRFVMG